jgi:uncharacterized protein YbaR (Trm112 family)
VSAPHGGHLVVSAPNRFSDAELAAEWQQAKRHEAVSVMAGQRNATRDILRCATLHRFASFPHFDEVPGWDAMSGFVPLRGVLHCPACGRFARVVDGLPDCVRHGVQEVAFT